MHALIVYSYGKKIPCMQSQEEEEEEASRTSRAPTQQK